MTNCSPTSLKSSKLSARRHSTTPSDTDPNSGSTLPSSKLERPTGYGRGLTNRQIAAKLVMGSETVKTHLSRVFEKLDLRNRAQLARLETKYRARRV